MKKTFITNLIASLLLISGLQAQSIQEGMNDLYAKRQKNAVEVFKKLIASNPNNIEAIYWLGQAYFNMDDNEAARQLYEKALATNGNAPLLLVGKGHADLLDKKNNDARQSFEAALTASRTRKGDDPQVQTAIGRAIVDSKTGDFKYAIELLKAASEKDPKNTETLLQLGNAYRKADPGKGGSDAYLAFNKALEVNPNFAAASVKLAKLFESQQNWSFVLKYLNDAVFKDPKFSDAYYELYWYYFLRRDFTEADNQLKKYIDSKLPVKDIMDEYLYGQLCYVAKDYDCAIAKANSVVNEMGAKTKPRVYKLLAYSYFDKGEFAAALSNVNTYFAKEKPDELISADYKLKADILAKTGGTPDDVYNTYIQGAAIDTVLSSKIDFLKEGAKSFNKLKIRDKEILLVKKVIELKNSDPKFTPNINDYFDLTIAYYFLPDYDKAREISLVMIDKFPDKIYGYEWAYNSAVAIATDTTRAVKQDSIGFPSALNLYEFTKKDTAAYKKQYINAVRFLAAYYINEAKDKDKSLEFFRKWLEVDPSNAPMIQNYIDQIEKMPASKPASQKGTASKPGAKP